MTISLPLPPVQGYPVLAWRLTLRIVPTRGIKPAPRRAWPDRPGGPAIYESQCTLVGAHVFLRHKSPANEVGSASAAVCGDSRRNVNVERFRP